MVQAGRQPRRAAKASVAAPPLAGTGGAEGVRVPAEFLEVAEEFFESGYEAPEEEEYA